MVNIEDIKPSSLLSDGKDISNENDHRLADAINYGLNIGVWHEQSAALAVWEITHALGTRCISVMCLDSSYQMMFPAAVLVEENKVTVTFASAVTGYCAILFAKTLVGPSPGPVPFPDWRAFTTDYLDDSGGMLSLGDPVYVSSPGLVKLASWDSEAESRVVGCVFYIDTFYSPAIIWVADWGKRQIFSGLTPLQDYFLGAGGYTLGPVPLGKYRRHMLFSVDTDTAHIQIYESELVS